MYGKRSGGFSGRILATEFECNIQLPIYYTVNGPQIK